MPAATTPQHHTPTNNTPPAKGGARWKQAAKILSITLILAVSLWYALRGVEWDTLWEAVLGVHFLWVLAGAAVTMLAHFFRAIRWRVLIPDGTTISRFNAYSATVIGYLMNNLIPRSGEVIRPYVLAKREQRTFSSLVATVVVERVLDGLTLLLLFVLLIVVASSRLDTLLPGYSAQQILLSLAIPILALVVLIALALGTSLGDRLVDILEKRLPAKFGTNVREFFLEFRSGIRFGGAKGVFELLVWTLAIWGGYALAFYCAILAFDFDIAYGLGMGDAIIMLGVTAVGITIAPTPGGFGVFHSFCRIALVSLYAVPVDQAVAFALVMHAAGYLAVTIFGVIFFLREGLSLGEATHSGTHPEELEGAPERV